MFKCASTNACYTATEVCVEGQCVPSCVDEKSCEDGFICHSQYKASHLLLFFKTYTSVIQYLVLYERL